MADLPKVRVEKSLAFTVTRIDHCGPFYYKTDVRKKSPQKCYISVLICFATKAVWLELVKDLTTASFLAALKRFTATRGISRCIWTDNATNFVGARNELEKLKRLLFSQKNIDDIHAHCLNSGFDWRFIPHRSPHFGGHWEAAVKMTKRHLYTSVGTGVLENPDDLGVLTPVHFLIGRPLVTFPEPDLSSSAGSLATRHPHSADVLEKVERGVFNSASKALKIAVLGAVCQGQRYRLHQGRTAASI
ncbi:uncharacterized protein LOC121404677 [Drosophila obscura]|uniref:uncharacterized protein LOC121404677 n=1 Tax=Drosophila obscura TaxID=7282 RepID=UPI001BB25E04|nr:uncharacterized protein LOC121404677 [Drosophila obscura]